jgi:hypothetical protein
VSPDISELSIPVDRWRLARVLRVGAVRLVVS